MRYLIGVQFFVAAVIMSVCSGFSGKIAASDRVLAAGTCAEAGFDAEEIAQINDAYRAETEEEDLYPFVVYIIARHGKIVAHEAFGWADRDKGVRIETDSIMHVASVTKAVTATAFMTLWDEGKVDLEDPVSKYIPAFENVRLEDGSKPSEPIRVTHLLTHNGGYYGHEPTDGIPEEEYKSREWTLADYAERLAQVPLRYAPGTDEHYSTYHTDILARIVEVISGREFTAFMHERLLDPLGMNDSTYHRPELKGRILAKVHGWKNDHWTVQQTGIEFGDAFPHGGYGLHTTAMDLAVMVQMVLNGGAYNGKTILSPKAVAKMLTMLSKVPHNTGSDWEMTRGASWEVGSVNRGVKNSELPDTIPTFPRKPDEPQRFFSRTGHGGMYIFGDRDGDLLGVFATRAVGPRGGGFSRKEFMLRVLNAASAE